MSVNPIEREKKQTDRALKRIEQRLDKTNQFRRDFQRDMRDIETLLRRGVIDAAEAIDLRASAHHKFEVGRQKHLAPSKAIETENRLEKLGTLVSGGLLVVLIATYLICKMAWG